MKRKKKRSFFATQKYTSYMYLQSSEIVALLLWSMLFYFCSSHFVSNDSTANDSEYSMCLYFIKHKIILWFSLAPALYRVEPPILPYHSHMFSLCIHMHSIFSGAHTFTMFYVVAAIGYSRSGFIQPTKANVKWKNLVHSRKWWRSGAEKKPPKQNHY